MSATAESTSVETVLKPIVQRFERLFLGRQPRECEIQSNAKFAVIRWCGILSDAEKRMLQADLTATGSEMVESLFRKMVRQSQVSLIGAVETTLGVKVSAVFCDMNSAADEAVLIITFAT